MMDARISNNAVLPYLDEEDFEQMRVETEKLVVENEMLRKRIAHLERQIVTHAWAGWKLH
jgi:ribosomal protein S13